MSTDPHHPSNLYAYKVQRDAALQDLQHARVELERAQKTFDKVDESYQKLVYAVLRELLFEGIEA